MSSLPNLVLLHFNEASLLTNIRCAFPNVNSIPQELQTADYHIVFVDLSNILLALEQYQCVVGEKKDLFLAPGKKPFERRCASELFAVI